MPSNLKTNNMRKLFAVLAIAAMFAACTNESTTVTSREDSIRRDDSIRKAEGDPGKMQQDNSNDSPKLDN